MWVKQCHKPPICEWFIPPIYGDLGDGLLNCCFTHINSFIDLNPQNAPYKMGHAPWTWPPSQTVFDDPKHEEPPFLSLSTIFRAMLTVSFLVPFPGSVPASELTNSQYFSNNSRWFSTIFNTSQHPKIQKIWSILVLFCVRTQPSWSSRTTGYGEDEACLLQIQGWCHRLGHGHWKRAEAQEWLGSLQWHCKLSNGGYSHFDGEWGSETEWDFGGPVFRQIQIVLPRNGVIWVDFRGIYSIIALGSQRIWIIEPSCFFGMLTGSVRRNARFGSFVEIDLIIPRLEASS